jgi:hypothetical protein
MLRTTDIDSPSRCFREWHTPLTAAEETLGLQPEGSPRHRPYHPDQVMPANDTISLIIAASFSFSGQNVFAAE